MNNIDKSVSYLKVLSIAALLLMGSSVSPVFAGIFAGNQLYVSTTGDDNVSRANNSISTPWQTIRQAMTLAQPGDVINFRAGTYSVNTRIETSGLGVDGTAGNRIVFTNYESEFVLFNGSDRIQLDKDYWTFSGINVDSTGRFLFVGDAGGGDNLIFEKGTFTQLAEGGGANFSPIYFFAGGGDNGIVRDSRFIGPGSDKNENTAGVFAFRTKGLKVLNNEFSGFPGGVYYKHPGVPGNTGIEIAYNYFHGNAKPIESSMINASIHDNLIVGGSLFLGGSAGTGDDGSNSGGDDNRIVHNTFYNARPRLIGQASGEGYGAQDNILRDNLIAKVDPTTQTFHLIPFKATPHGTTLNYNLYPTGDMIHNNGTSYTLTEWQAFYGQDANSIAGTPVFVGGSSPSSIADYALVSGSPGDNAGSDGFDMGANINLVGPDGLGLARPNPPSQVAAQ